jgi:hypothetical protein
MSPRGRWLGAIVGALLPLCGAHPVSAAGTPALLALSIGYNGVPAGAEADRLQPLRFADDDAARVHQFIGTLGGRSRLLSLFDRETAARFPALLAEARPPTRAELGRAVAELRREADAAARAGFEPVIVIYYSGHGRRHADGHGALTLLDGELTQRLLYEEVLAGLGDYFAHLLVDACHAEATVRTRDLDAKQVDLPAEQLAEYVKEKTLAQFPRVGAIVASNGNALANEWELYQGGVFTHELLSGLRGAADVDGNGRIEYSELGAFMAAANRAVVNPQARLEAVIQAPPANPRAAIVSLKGGRGAWLEGTPGPLRSLHIEDATGERLLDLHAEVAFKMALLLPADVALFVRTADREAQVRLHPGDHVDFEQLQFRTRELADRGALESALRRGLFATAFGPSYYRGFVDRHEVLVPVDVSAVELALTTRPSTPSRTPAWLAFGGAGALAGTSVAFGVATLQTRNAHDAARTEEGANTARSLFDRDLRLTIGFGIGALVSAGIGWWLWPGSSRTP